MKLFHIRHQISFTGIVGCLLLCLCSGAPAKPLQVFNRQSKEEVFSLAFSPDGQMLAVGSSAPSTNGLPEGTIELWSLKKGSLDNTLHQSAKTENSDQANRVSSISFSPDGKWVVGSDVVGYTLWELATGKEKFKWQSGIIDPEKSVGWSGDSRVLVLPSMENEPLGLMNGIAVIDVSTGKRTAFFPVVAYDRAARISPNGRLLATTGQDGIVRVFDLAARTNIFSDNTQGTLYTACFSPNGRWLIGGSGFGGVLLIYEITSSGGKVTINKLGNSLATELELHQIEFTPDGKQAFANCYGAVALWDATSWTTPRQLPNCRGRLSPDGTQVALVRDQSPDIIELWNLDELAKTMRQTVSR
jgi:WD40 repeat protein